MSVSVETGGKSGKKPLNADLNLVATDGLDPGFYFYRVSGVLSAANPNNPGGETLTGDEFAIDVPDVAPKKIQVTIAWVPAGSPQSVRGRPAQYAQP